MAPEPRGDAPARRGAAGAAPPARPSRWSPPGVDEHSDFRADPWARLQATLRSYLTIVYGTATAARAEIRRLNGLHRSITRPRLRRPRPGAGAVGPRDARRHDDRRLRRLDRAAARATQRAATTPRRCRSAGRSAMPADRPAAGPRRVRGVRRRDARARTGRSASSPTARELADAVLHPPLGPVVPPLAGGPAAAYAWTLWPSIGLLPRVRPRRTTASAGARSSGRSCVARRRLAGLAAGPAAAFRQMPQALAADRRLG